MKKLNNLIRIILICIILVLGIFANNLFFKNHKYVNKADEKYAKEKLEAKKVITSYDIIDKMLAETLKKINTQKEKQELGISNNDNLKLLEYKSDAYSFLEGWDTNSISNYRIDCANKACCYGCILNNSAEVTPDMFSEYGMLRSSRLIELYIKLNNLYKNGSITQDEFDLKKQEYVIYNEKLIKIAQEVDKATSIPDINKCSKCTNQNIKTKVEMSDKNIDDNQDVYKSIGVSKQCFDDFKMIIDAEGYLPENSKPCSDDENKKVIEYIQTHPNTFD